jgi:predicted dehydrogenase
MVERITIIKTSLIMNRLRIAIAGCGQISGQYGEHINAYPDLLEIVGATDLDPERARNFCKEFGGCPYESLDAILEDESVDVVVNLTIHHAHFDLNRRALEAGKHVFSEKPMALTHAQADELLEVARRTGQRLAAAPTTFLGEGLQTAARFLEEDRLGPLRLVYAEVNWAQIERWIGNAKPYFTVGPLLDVGVYAITALTFMLGPVRQVWGYSAILKNPRVDKDGAEVPVTAPDFTVGMMEFESGVVARVTTNYYVSPMSLPHLRGLEFHGDEGSFTVSSYHDFQPVCRFLPYDKEPVEIPLVRPVEKRSDRAVGLADLALAIRENRPHRSSGEQAAHVIEIMEGLQRSADERRPVEIHSSFPKCSLMPWASAATLDLP